MHVQAKNTLEHLLLHKWPQPQTLFCAWGFPFEIKLGDLSLSESLSGNEGITLPGRLPQPLVPTQGYLVAPSSGPWLTPRTLNSSEILVPALVEGSSSRRSRAVARAVAELCVTRHRGKGQLPGTGVEDRQITLEPQAPEPPGGHVSRHASVRSGAATAAAVRSAVRAVSP